MNFAQQTTIAASGRLALRSKVRWLHRLLVACLLGLAACGSFEEKRIRELLHEKGFGTRAQGDATRENYVGGSDAVLFLLPPTAALQEGAERLVELTAAQAVGIDGTLFLPYLGPVYVLGKTELELAAMVRTMYRSVFNFQIDLEARIVGSRKYIYAFGETRTNGRIPIAEADLTLIDAVAAIGWTPLANLGRVLVIRPDAENPLVIDVNLREMLTTGYTAANISIRERDIIYIPPTILGFIANLLRKILEPVGVAVATIFGFADIQYAADVLRGDAGYRYFRY
jgi:protein involved in polysaccharide export with SLBB domain